MRITRWCLKNRWKDIILSFFDAIREIGKDNKGEPKSTPNNPSSNQDKGSSITKRTTKPRDTARLKWNRKKRTDPTKAWRTY